MISQAIFEGRNYGRVYSPGRDVYCTIDEKQRWRRIFPKTWRCMRHDFESRRHSKMYRTTRSNYLSVIRASLVLTQSSYWLGIAAFLWPATFFDLQEDRSNKGSFESLTQRLFWLHFICLSLRGAGCGRARHRGIDPRNSWKTLGSGFWTRRHLTRSNGSRLGI